MAMRGIEELKYVFDLKGYVVVKGALSPSTVLAANTAIDANIGMFKERLNTLRNSHKSAVSAFTGDGLTGRYDCGKILSFPSPHGEVFRDLLAHPPLVPLLTSLLGAGYRLDHLPLAIIQKPGAEGFPFHGGAVNEQGEWADEISYDVRHGTIRCRLINVAFALTQTRPGEGGFVVIPGSHKANFPLPSNIANLSCPLNAQLLETPTLEAGDAVVFTEAVSHGAFAWTGDSDRRTLFYRYAPCNQAYGRAYSEGAISQEVLAQMSPVHLAIIQPPFHPRLDRKSLVVDNDGSVVVTVPHPRAQEKKDYDSEVYGHPYF